MARRTHTAVVLASVGLGLALMSVGRAQAPGPRLALVIGEATYRDRPLATAANDAALVAATLEAAGFTVTAGADLDRDGLRRTLRQFLVEAGQAGPEATAFIYLAGRGVQYAGDNFIVPVDATIVRDADVPLQAVPLGQLTEGLAALPLRARVLVLDGARANEFARSGPPLAGGLALVEPPPGLLYALNAAPGTIAPEEPGPYGVYALALAELLRQGGVSVDQVFARARLRVNVETRGAVVPWDIAPPGAPLVLLAAAPTAPPPVLPPAVPPREVPPAEAYAVAVARDTLAGYETFLAAFPADPLVGRVRLLLAARREALTWARSAAANVPTAFWTYLRRYPRGPHVADARRRLDLLGAPLEPPPRFDIYDFEGVPPPPESEDDLVEDRRLFDFDVGAAPPPPPEALLPRRDPAFDRLSPPVPAADRGGLPVPVPLPLPFGRPPGGPGRIEPPHGGPPAPPPTPAAAPRPEAPAPSAAVPLAPPPAAPAPAAPAPAAPRVPPPRPAAAGTHPSVPRPPTLAPPRRPPMPPPRPAASPAGQVRRVPENGP